MTERLFYEYKKIKYNNILRDYCKNCPLKGKKVNK